MVAFAAMWCVSCSKDDEKDLPNEENKEGVITMGTEEKEVYLKVCSFNEGDVITIDWGDGRIEEFKTEESYDDDEVYYGIPEEAEHNYSDNSKSHPITIKGKIKMFTAQNSPINVRH